MKFKKIYLLVLISIFLSGCIQSTALLAPGVTIATTGNICKLVCNMGLTQQLKKKQVKMLLHIGKKCSRRRARKSKI